MNVILKGELPQEEIDRYVAYVRSKPDGSNVQELEIEVDGDYVNLTKHYVPRHFQRIRRITGYLVGTMEQWNNAKTAEERDGVKHL